MTKEQAEIEEIELENELENQLEDELGNELENQLENQLENNDQFEDQDDDDQNEFSEYKGYQLLEQENEFNLNVKPVEPLDEETVQQIKDIMKNITIPDDAIPEWAKRIPEHLWLPKSQ
jgi:hypothetical protein